MPLGEDVPILIPISIVLVIFILSLFALYSNFSERTEIVEMSQKSLNIAEYIISNEDINFKFENTCRKLEELNISSNYKVQINVTNLDNNRWDCWGGIVDSRIVVRNSIPLLIDGELNKVVVSVGK